MEGLGCATSARTHVLEWAFLGCRVLYQKLKRVSTRGVLHGVACVSTNRNFTLSLLRHMIGSLDIQLTDHVTLPVLTQLASNMSLERRCKSVNGGQKTHHTRGAPPKTSRRVAPKDLTHTSSLHFCLHGQHFRQPVVNSVEKRIGLIEVCLKDLLAARRYCAM